MDFVIKVLKGEITIFLSTKFFQVKIWRTSLWTISTEKYLVGSLTDSMVIFLAGSVLINAQAFCALGSSANF